MFDFNIFRTEFEEKNRQNQMRTPKLISSQYTNACNTVRYSHHDLQIQHRSIPKINFNRDESPPPPG